MFKQCDPRWGSTQMGVSGPGEQATICKEGCAMTSLAMGLHSLGLWINDKEVDPGVLNAWLQANDGYVCAAGDCNNLRLDAPERLPGSPLVFEGEKEKPALDILAAWADSALEIVLAHVRNNHHFVLLLPSPQAATGVFNVLDPGYNSSTYHYDNISDVIRYRVSRDQGVIAYPTFKQCASQWADDTMGENGKTICQVGCLMSSISEALNGHGIDIGGKPADPQQLNAFLRSHPGGYVDNSSSLDESIVPQVDPQHISWPADGMHKNNDLAPAEIAKYLGIAPGQSQIQNQTHRVVIANVLHGEHFVLVTGLGGKNRTSENSSVFVRDSGFARDIYSYSEVVGWRIFDMVSV